ncbi:rod shape-determining protein MreD [Lutimonas sp.]|jgi:rod shape-determining protein MreD|uniref:rod shape-determining protein MreD n=1 Tax=Lutimonas sp. TaxID=1872403 RepID=UPI003C78B964
MNRDNINNALLFIGLILLQIIVLNNINFLGYINPYFYIFFIFLYPIKKDDASVLILSFFLGLCIDIFSDSGGINAAATLFIAFIRIPILQSVIGKREIDYGTMTLFKLPFPKMFLYVVILTVIHHFIVFGMEYFKWSKFGIILLNTVLTSIFTIILTMISLTFVTSKR